jgi:hypothetical protein
VLQFVVHPLVFFMATLTFIAVIVMLVLAWLDATGKRPVTVE